MEDCNMVYTYEGDQILGNNYFSNAINEINIMMNDLVSLLEKETIARNIDTMSGAGLKSTISSKSGPNLTKMENKGKNSMLSGDVFSARQSATNNFDEKKAKMILESEDICKEYEAWCSMDFDRMNSIFGRRDTGPDNNAVVMYYDLLDDGFSAEEVKRYILEQFYQISDDPEKIKKLLKLRLNYNKKMLSLYQKMIQMNYDVLNLTKSEAEGLFGASADEIRDVILRNKNKFIKRGGTFYDLRELGFGVCYIQKSMTGLEQFSTLEHMINLMMRYDVVFLTHGSFNNLTFANLIKDKNFLKECIFFVKFYTKYTMLTRIVQMGGTPSPKLVKEVEELSKDMDLKSALGVNDPIYGPVGIKSKWLCQPIYTENKGPFRNVVKLIEQCIQEARENKKNYNMVRKTDHVHIMVMCCNPGGIPLPKSITGQKDVHIHYGKRSVMPENASISDIDQNIEDGERYLHEFCNSIGIDYNDDDYLTECYNSVTDEDIDMLSEGLVNKAWEAVKTIAKKIWAAIVAAFKWIWEFIKKIWNAIKALFVKNKDNEVNDVSYIKLEGAKVSKETNLTFGQAYQKILNSCDRISGQIKTLERTQTAIMKKIDQDLDKK